MDNWEFSMSVQRAGNVEKLAAIVVIGGMALSFAAYWWTGDMVEAVARGEQIEAWRARAIGLAYAVSQGLGLARAIIAGVCVRRAGSGWTSWASFAVWFGGIVFLLPLLIVV